MTRPLLAIILALSLRTLSLADDLRDAVETGDVEKVKDLLEAGADANRSYENRFTPIYFASNSRVVDLLLAHGARLDIRDAAALQSPIESAAESYYRQKNPRQNWKLIVEKLRDAGPSTQLTRRSI